MRWCLITSKHTEIAEMEDPAKTSKPANYSVLGMSIRGIADQLLR